MKKRITAFILSLSVSFSATAEWSDIREISLLKTQGNGIYFELKGFVSSSSIFNCSRGFWLPQNSENYQARVSTLLAAFMSRQPVNISYYGCLSSHNEAGSIQMQ